MSRPSRRDFLKRALAGLCLPGLPVLLAAPAAAQESIPDLLGVLGLRSQSLVPATEEAVQEAALNTLRSGEIPERQYGVNWIVTHKEPLKTESPMFLFGDPKFLGDAWRYYPETDSWAHVVNGVVRDHNPPY